MGERRGFVERAQRATGRSDGARRSSLGGAKAVRARLLRIPLALRLAVVVLAGLGAACETPHATPRDPATLFDTQLLGFVRDGQTKREEVLMRLGVPTAQFEQERILLYQIKADKQGAWHLVAPRIDGATQLRQWDQGTCSLVLVFGGDGVLTKHSLVVPE